MVRLQLLNTGWCVPHTSMAGALLGDSLNSALLADVAVSETFLVTVADIFLWTSMSASE